MTNCPVCSQKMYFLQQIRGIIKHYLCCKCWKIFKQIGQDGKFTDLRKING